MKFGVQVTSSWPLARSTKYVSQIENLGYDSISAGNHIMDHDTFVLLALVARETQRVRVLTNVIPMMPYARTPAILAASAASLSELSGGRAVLGVGSGDSDDARLLGGVWKKPALAVREGVAIIKRLLAGETVTYQGEIYSLKDAKLGLQHGWPHPDPQIPVLVGAEGPIMIRITGEVADGIIFTRTTFSYYKRAIELYLEGLRRSGRKLSDVEVHANVLACISDDKDYIIKTMKPLVASAIEIRLPPAWKMMGISKEFAEAIKKDPELVPDEMVEEYGICGTVEDCISRIKEFDALGFDQLNLVQMAGGWGKRKEAVGEKTSWWETIKTFGESIRPAFKETPIH